MDILERIKELQKERGWTNYRLCAEANIPNVTLTNMYARKTLPSMTTLSCLCDAFGISMAEFFNKDKNSIMLTDDEKRLISEYRRLNKKNKNAVSTLVKDLND